MTYWTAPQEPRDRKPRAGDRIENEAALDSLVFSGDGIVVRDGSDEWASVENRTFAVYADGGASPFTNGRERDLRYPLTVLWSPWDEARP